MDLVFGVGSSRRGLFLFGGGGGGVAAAPLDFRGKAHGLSIDLFHVMIVEYDFVWKSVSFEILRNVHAVLSTFFRTSKNALGNNLILNVLPARIL